MTKNQVFPPGYNNNKMPKVTNIPRINNMQPQQQQFDVDLSTATQRKCKCGCLYFTSAAALYTVSALVSPNGQELVANVPVMICCNCKEVMTNPMTLDAVKKE